MVKRWLGRAGWTCLVEVLDLITTAFTLVVSGGLVLIAVSEVSTRDALWQQAERLSQADFAGEQLDAETVVARRAQTRVLVEALIERGEAPDNDGIHGIRAAVKLQNGGSKPSPSWNLRAPIEGATWAFARTRSDFLLANASMLSGLIGVFLTRLPKKGRIFDFREMLHGAALSLVAFLLLRYGGQLAFVARTSGAQDVKLNPFFAAIVGLLCGLERHQFQSSLSKMFKEFTTKDRSPGTKDPPDGENGPAPSGAK